MGREKIAKFILHHLFYCSQMEVKLCSKTRPMSTKKWKLSFAIFLNNIHFIGCWEHRNNIECDDLEDQINHMS
jgi:hypothetical protein